jgi:hypothetical protein
MKRHLSRFGRRAGLSGAVAVLAATVVLANASAAGTPKPDSCPTNKPLVVDAYNTVTNAADYGADGHVWALDDLTNTIQIWHLGGDAYCVKVHSFGTSTTFAGVSPEGTGTVRAGVIAAADGGWYERINGTFAPTVPTTGFIGTIDAQCNQDGTCAQPLPGVAGLYFSSVHHDDFGAFSFTADAGACGTWRQSAGGNTGDIVC